MNNRTLNFKEGNGNWWRSCNHERKLLIGPEHIFHWLHSRTTGPLVGKYGLKAAVGNYAIWFVFLITYSGEKLGCQWGLSKQSLEMSQSRSSSCFLSLSPWSAPPLLMFSTTSDRDQQLSSGSSCLTLSLICLYVCEFLLCFEDLKNKTLQTHLGKPAPTMIAIV